MLPVPYIVRSIFQSRYSLAVPTNGYEDGYEYIGATYLQRRNPKLKGKAEKVSSRLNELKKTMVITTGDNYVGTVDPELREKLATIYSKIAGSYDAPSSSELATVAAVTQRYDNAMADLDKIVDKEWTNLIKAAAKAEVVVPTMKDKADFLED